MEAVFGVVRHILTGLGVYLVSKGYVTDGAVQEGVGAIITLLNVVWFALAKSPKFPAIK